MEDATYYSVHEIRRVRPLRETRLRNMQLADDPVCPKGFKFAEFVLLEIRFYEEDDSYFFLTLSCRQFSASGQGFGG